VVVSVATLPPPVKLAVTDEPVEAALLRVTLSVPPWSISAICALPEMATSLTLKLPTVPPPSVIWHTFVDLAATGELQRHALATVSRVAAGFAFGVAAGTVLGAIAGYSALTHRIVDPTLQALRSIPSIAWVPLFILWFGIFEASKVILIAVGVFFPVYLGVMGAVM